MTVKELMNLLSTMPPDAHVLASSYAEPGDRIALYYVGGLREMPLFGTDIVHGVVFEEIGAEMVH